MQDIALFPLNTVLYPEGLLPLRVFEQRYVDMTKACIAQKAAFGVCLILDGAEAGTPAVPHAVGCTARVVEWEVPGPGLFNLLVRGESAFRIGSRRVMPDGLIRADVQLEPPATPMPLPVSYRGLGEVLGEVMRQVGHERFPQPLRTDDSAWVCHRLAEVLAVPQAARQRLLEATAPAAKLELTAAMLRTLVA